MAEQTVVRFDGAPLSLILSPQNKGEKRFAKRHEARCCRSLVVHCRTRGGQAAVIYIFGDRFYAVSR